MDQGTPDGNRERAKTPPSGEGRVGAWDYLSEAGLAEPVLRLGTHALLVVSILLIAWGLRSYYSLAASLTSAQSLTTAQNELQGEAPSQIAGGQARLPFFQLPTVLNLGVPRQVSLHTFVPSRSRLEVITYIVQPGDTLFGLAARFGLKPETILWANQLVLGDNPHKLHPGQELLILPVDGVYHRWSAGDSLNAVANFFGVRPEDIVNFPSNHLEGVTEGEIAPGTWLIIPGGRREFVSWSAPDIPRDNPGVAKVLGPGACEKISDGVIGSGVFIWPADSRFLSGFDYEPGANHFGIDIAGNEGDPAYAADSGVVVYAGWNNWGYGYMVVINHGNGWQTLYAHLNAIYVNCGQSVERETVIGAIGATGNAPGANLHFEMMYQGVRVDPHNYINE